ncbi:MAG: DNA-processing protein DprA [Acidimicrobiia bacterium]
MNDAKLQVAFGGLHPDRVATLYERYGPAGVRKRIMSGAIETTERVRRAVGVPAGERRAELTRAGIEVVGKGEEVYPAHLGELPDAPELLFVRGSLPGLPGVAIVGTRRCTAYGRRIAGDYGRAVAAAGWVVVSGLARGVDGAAHRGTVAGGGVGVAVLGSGIDVMYPREHAGLARQLITGGGAVISESPPGTPPEAWRFPPRNRIISGLAGAVVVVEATVKGGALITAETALRQGRQVFAVPGDIDRASSAGCNLLIRDGAFPVLDPDDLIESLQLVLGPAPGIASQVAACDLGDDDARLVELIRSGADDLDALMGHGLGAPGEILAALGRLELNGVLRTDGPGRYAVTHRVGR